MHTPVKQFRQFVQRCCPQKLSQCCQPLRIRKKTPIFITAVGHRAKFNQPEGVSMQTGADLSEKNGPTHSGINGNSNGDKQWGEADETAYRKAKIEKTFYQFWANW